MLVEFTRAPDNHEDFCADLLELIHSVVEESASEAEMELWDSGPAGLSVRIEGDELHFDLGRAEDGGLVAYIVRHWAEVALALSKSEELLREHGAEWDIEEEASGARLFEVDGLWFAASSEHGWIASEAGSEREQDVTLEVREGRRRAVAAPCQCSLCVRNSLDLG